MQPQLVIMDDLQPVFVPSRFLAAFREYQESLLSEVVRSLGIPSHLVEMRMIPYGGPECDEPTVVEGTA